MGKHSRCWIDKVLPPSSDSSDSSEDECSLDLQRYTMAEFSMGLNSR